MLCNFLRILESWANFQNLKEINEIKNFKPSHRPNPACLGLGLAHGVWAGFFTKGAAKLGPWRHWGGSPAVPALPAARQPTDDATGGRVMWGVHFTDQSTQALTKIGRRRQSTRRRWWRRSGALWRWGGGYLRSEVQLGGGEAEREEKGAEEQSSPATFHEGE
jgi:hypothetical protein